MQAKGLGFDTSVLRPVQQEDCTYAGAGGANATGTTTAALG